MEYELGTVRVKAEIQEESETRIDSFNDVARKYEELGWEQKEHFYAVFLTNGNEEIGDKLIGLGGLDTTPVDVQDVVRTAVLVKAGAVILVHNHPSGKAEATPQDVETTEEIYEVLNHLGTSLLDHVIVAHNHSYSMKANHDGPF